MISFIFEAEQNFTSSMVAMWCTSSAQFTNSNIEHIWKDSQLIHTENIYALLGGFWHGRSFSGTGGEAKFVWCARHTWSLTLEPSAAVMSSSSLCYWGVGTFYGTGFLFLLPGRLETVPGLHPFTGTESWSQCGLEIVARLWCDPSPLTGSELIPESIQVCRNRRNAYNIFMFTERHPHEIGELQRGGEGETRAWAEV